MARIKGPRKINQYGDEFKIKAMRLSQLPGGQVKDVAASLDIPPFMLSKWRKQVHDGLLTAENDTIIEPESAAELKYLRQIEKEHVRLEQEHELQKNIRFCSDIKQTSPM